MKEQVSALFDGDIEPGRADPVFRSLVGDEELQRSWLAYGLIGDALRGADNLAGDLTARIMRELSDEPTVLAPGAMRTTRRWPRTLMPIAASVFGIAAVALVAQSLRQPEEAVTVAQAPRAPVETVAVLPAATPVPAEVQRLRDQSIQAYLVAHQGFSPSSGMQGVAPYVRTVSEQGFVENR